MRGMLRSLRSALLPFALLAVLVGCTSQSSAPPPPTAPAAGGATAAKPTAAPAANAPGNHTFDGTLLFGAPISLTGSTAKEGGLTRDGYDLWRDTYNKAGDINVGGKHYKIETKYYDDASNAQQAATLSEKLIKEDKVNFLLGPYGTSPTLQVSTVVEKNKMPMIEGNGAAESIFSQGYKYTFGVLSPAQNYLRGVVDLSLSLDPKPTTVAVLSADDPFSVEVADAARGYTEQKGLQVVYYQKYPNASTDLRAPLKYQGDDLFKTPEAYNTLYKQTFGYEPAYQSAESTACGIAFIKAIEKAGTTDPDKVRDEIAKLNFTSFYGQIKFDERGINVTKPMAVEQWQNGRRVTVWPTDVAEGKPLWPFPSWSGR